MIYISIGYVITAVNLTMKNILLLGTGKSATVLIKRLYEMSMQGAVQVTIADLRVQHLESYSSSSGLSLLELDVSDADKVRLAVASHDLVVSLMPPSLHAFVAKICLSLGKHFLTASYLDKEISALNKEIAAKGLFFVNEMGLDPGIDHLLAMEMISEIQHEGGEIKTFESYCGGLVAPSSDTNPMHYKITWNPLNIVNAGKAGAQYLDHGNVVKLEYRDVFKYKKDVSIAQKGDFEMYPNRDSLSYIDLYGLGDVQTFVRGTLRLPGFCAAWLELIDMGLTHDGLSLSNEALLKLKNEAKNPAVQWLLADTFIPTSAKHAGDFLLDTISQKLFFEDGDKDRVVLFHKIGYLKEGEMLHKTYIMDRIGINKQYTAMAETVGMPLLACIELILENKFKQAGVLLPTDNQHYKPILERLRQYGVLH